MCWIKLQELMWWIIASAWFMVYFEISPNELEIYPNELEISSNHLEISAIHLEISTNTVYLQICDPSGRNQSHVGRVRFPLRAEMHWRAHITDSCFIAFITSKIC